MRKFGIRDQIGYVFGDMAGSFVNLYVDAFFLTFCTYVLGINALWMGTMFLTARLWDAINDPIIGSFPDRWTIGKSGDKFKPYIKIAMIPLAVAGVLCFTDVSAASSVFKHIWVAAVYILYGMSYTGTSMPYGAMANVITDKPIERTKLSTARSIGGMIVGYGALSFVPMFTFNKAGDILPKGFFLVSIAFGILSLASYVVLLRLTTERIKQPRSADQKYNYGNVLKSVFKNRPLIGVMVATIGSLIAITAQSQLRTYLYKEYYEAPQLMTAVALASIPITLIGLFIIPKMSEKLGKRNLILYSVLFNLVFSAYLLIVPIKNVYLFSVLNIIANIGQTVFIMTIWALVADCLDYGELMTGERNDGSTYSIYTFSRKLGATLASSLASFALAGIGFISGVESQTAAVASNIRILVLAVPVVACILELIGIGLIFNLTKEKTEDMYAQLRERRAANNVQAQ